MKQLRRDAWFFYSALIFALFYFITSRSPLAGDDWGYALNGMLYNPFSHALTFYFTWSGRYFSELYGFLVAPNRWAWNLINPTLFTLIFILGYRLIRQKDSLIAPSLMMFLMISVKDELRMETYTWLMGTTYVIPLMLTLFYLYEMKRYLLDAHRLKPVENIAILISLFVIGMGMENISAVVFLLGVVFIVIFYLQHKEWDITLITQALVSLAALLLLRFSPGAAFRLQRDHAAWLKMNPIEQIVSNYSSFIRFTFIEHRYLILTLSLLLLALMFKNAFKKNRFTILNAIQAIILSVAVFSSLSLTLSVRFPMKFWTIFVSTDSSFNLVFWILYIVIVYTVLWGGLTQNRLTISLVLVTLAGFSNGVMMLSPIFSYRSSLYTVYFLILLSVLIVQEFENAASGPLLSLVLLALICKFGYVYWIKYSEVAKADAIRQSEIQYYLDHPEVKEAWLIRYPIYSIHSGDIEDGDDYHMEVFKRYYGLSNDVRLFFYYPK